MSTLELYTKGARIWIPDPTLVWKPAEVTENFKEKQLKITLEDGTEETISISSNDKLPPLRNPQILIGENDLTSLSYLHEPAVLYNLQVRFCNHNAIYTYCGIVLVAINPYEELPIYGTDTIFAYRGQSMGDLDPHIFAVAEEAYTKVERENLDQSIIVSGESGAGKTVSAKYTMRYFATVGGSTTETHIEKKVLASNPIMEAIGNAKTTRNDNSSRFGKYIELDFNNKFHIIGANMRTYLLEKSRVVFQANEERNYHIFYQLCASSDLEEFKDLHLGCSTNFRYLNQGNSPTIEGVNDAKLLEDTRNALALLGFSDSQQLIIFRILASILHMGNISIKAGGQLNEDAESSMVKSNDQHLRLVASLLEVDYDQMRTWLCNRKIQSMREVITKPITVNEASFSRDALAKHIYERLFSWIVTQINKSLASSEKIVRFIGVLDIYGFETFETNSFEQFCINYANEKLQQQFNLHVFKLEQEEYVREGIEWKFIDFYDNQPCIDLIENKMGILALLNEECLMPQGSDETWCRKLYTQCKASKHFEKPRLSNTAFIVIHFADDVQYEVKGFLDKNHDKVTEELINILKASQLELVGELFEDPAAAGSKLKPIANVRVNSSSAPQKSSKNQHKKTVGSQFQDSLTLLMKTLNNTTPHYVRCIKPNDQKANFTFEPKRAIQQLRACGVLETVRISAAGYPSRWTYTDFLHRYRVLAKNLRTSDLRASCKSILEALIKEVDKFQFGKAKIFFRSGQVAYLEKLRAERLKACAIMVQKYVKGWLQRKRYLQIQKSIRNIQRFGRGLLARRLAVHYRRTRAAIIIQKWVRMFVCRSKFVRIRNSILLIQTQVRGNWARNEHIRLKKNASAVIIQKHVRRWILQRKYQRTLKRIIIAQSCVRRWSAKRQFKKLKIIARSVEHVKKLNVGLENKIISLQQRIETLLKEKKGLQNKQEDNKELAIQADKVKGLESGLKGANNRITELEDEIRALRIEVDRIKLEKQDLLSEKELLAATKNELVARLNEDNSNLQEEVSKMKEIQRETEIGVEALIKTRVNNEKKMLLEEFDTERSAYQKLLKENARLEQRFENLQGEITRLKGSGHQRTSSNVSLVSDDVHDDDVGYGSVRSRDVSHSKLDEIRWEHSGSSRELTPEEEAKKPVVEFSPPDISIVLKLQQKLKALESKNSRLEKIIENYENKEDDSPKEEHMIRDIRLQELEKENSKLKDDNNRLRKTMASEDPNAKSMNLMDQFDALQDELERRREECLQLRTVLNTRSLDMKTTLAFDHESINEDGELLMAFDTQKKLNRQLESELQAEKIKGENSDMELRHEIKKLQEDNERQQKLLSQNLKKSPQAQTEAILQHEINRLTGENVDLREKIDNQNEQIKKLKKQVKIFAKKLKDGGSASKRSSALFNQSSNIGDSMISTEVKVDKADDNMPAVKHKETKYMGMLEYKKEDEAQIIKHLVYEFKPKLAGNYLPGLPAYILFMCIRHTDYINDDDKVRSLLNSTLYGIKRVIAKKHEHQDYAVLWLANTCRLLHNLKQYSGDKAFQTDNSPKQNEQCLRNFDLSEYRQVLSDIAVWIYQAVMKNVEERVQPLIVPAILEHESIPGISSNKPQGMRGRSSSIARELDSPVDPHQALETLLAEMNNFFQLLSHHGVDPEIITQVYKQLFYIICAGALNNLLLRKDVCHWSKGMQIRYNLSNLEQWSRDKNMGNQVEVIQPLQPIIQAAQLLQARKLDEDVTNVMDMCDKLTTTQIVKILNLYTPADDFEERVPSTFIRKIQKQLSLRDEGKTVTQQNTLLMDTKFAFPIRFPFSPSSINLEDINIPEALSLPFLKKV